MNALAKGGEVKPRKVQTGLLTQSALVQFLKAEGSSINLVGKAVGYKLIVTVDATVLFNYF